MTFEMEPKTGYAVAAVGAARKAGLSSKVFSFSDILEQSGGDPIERCAEVTGTAYGEQLRFLLASDKPMDGDNYGCAAVGCVSYDDRVHFGKFARLLKQVWDNYESISTSKFSPRNADVYALDIEPGFLGVNANARFERKAWDPAWGEFSSDALLPYVFDSSIRDLSRICFPTGKGKADELIVVANNGPMGEKLDEFLTSFIGGGFVVGDIRKT